MSEGKVEFNIKRRINAVSAVMRALRRIVVVKKDLSQTTKLSIYLLSYVPTSLMAMSLG